MWYVYFLELQNQSIYVGYTQNVEKRLIAHNRGDVESTKPHRPAQLKTYIAVDDKNIAINLEKYFKSGSGKAFALKRFGLR